MCIYVLMCVSAVCICVYECVYVCTRVCIYVCIHVHVCVHVCTYVRFVTWNTAGHWATMAGVAVTVAVTSASSVPE